MADDDDRMQCVCLGPKRAPVPEGESVLMSRFYRARRGERQAATACDVLGELSCTSPFDGWTFADCGFKRTLWLDARRAPWGIVVPECRCAVEC